MPLAPTTTPVTHATTLYLDFLDMDSSAFARNHPVDVPAAELCAKFQLFTMQGICMSQRVLSTYMVQRKGHFYACNGVQRPRDAS